MDASNILFINRNFNHQLTLSLWSTSEKSPSNLTDVTFKCKNGSVRGHSLYLKQCCSLIKLVFTEDLLLQDLVVVLPDFNVEDVTKYLELLYTGKTGLANANEFEAIKQLVALTTAKNSNTDQAGSKNKLELSSSRPNLPPASGVASIPPDKPSPRGPNRNVHQQKMHPATPIETLDRIQTDPALPSWYTISKECKTGDPEKSGLTGLKRRYSSGTTRVFSGPFKHGLIDIGNKGLTKPNLKRFTCSKDKGPANPDLSGLKSLQESGSTAPPRPSISFNEAGSSNYDLIFNGVKNKTDVIVEEYEQNKPKSVLDDFHRQKRQTPFECSVLSANHKTSKQEKDEVDDDEIFFKSDKLASSGDQIQFKKKPGSRLVCVLCGSQFPDKSKLDRHVRGVHENVRPYVCDLCHYKFKEKSHLKRHINIVHQSNQMS